MNTDQIINIISWPCYQSGSSSAVTYRETVVGFTSFMWDYSAVTEYIIACFGSKWVRSLFDMCMNAVLDTRMSRN